MNADTRPVPHLVIFGAAVLPDGRASGTLRRRVEGALAIASALPEPDAVFVATGAVGRHGDAEAIVMRRLLARAGVSPDRILVETEGHDTLSSARHCAKILAARRPRVSQVIVCSSRYHNPRCAGLLRILGVRASWRAMPTDRGNVPLHRLLYFHAREAPAIVWDFLVLGWLVATRRVNRISIDESP